MGGFLGIGGNGPDKQKESASQSNLHDIFSRGLSLSDQQNQFGNQQRQQGTQNLTNATDYWNRLLTAGRPEAAQLAAPAVNAQLAQEDATRKQQAQMGTGRTGATVANNQTAATNSQSNIDNIINENLVGGRKEAASGLAGAGETQLGAGSSAINQALSALGLGSSAEGDVLKSAQADRAGVRDAQTQIWSTILRGLL